MASTIPNQSNIGDIINAIGDNKDTVITAIKNIVTVINYAEKIDFKQLSKNGKNFLKAKSIISSYLMSINEIIDILATSIDGKDINTILGRKDIEELKYGDDGKETELAVKTEYTAIEALKQISNVFSLMTKGITDMANFKGGFFATRKLKKNVKLIAGAVTMMIKEIIDTFSHFNGDELNSLLEVLASKPDQIITDINQRNGATGKDGSTKTEHTVTNKGKQGLIDVLLNFFTMLDTMTKLKAPNIIAFKFEIKKFKFLLSGVIKDLGKTVQKWSNDKQLTSALDQFSGEDGMMGSMESGKGILGIIFTLDNVFNTISEINEKGGNVKALIKTKLMFHNFNFFLSKLNEVLGDNGLAKQLANEKILDVIETNKSIADSFNELVNAYNEFPINFTIRAILIKKGYKSLMSITSLLIEKVNELQESIKDIQNIKYDVLIDLINKMSEIADLMNDFGTKAKMLLKYKIFIKLFIKNLNSIINNVQTLNIEQIAQIDLSTLTNIIINLRTIAVALAQLSPIAGKANRGARKVKKLLKSIGSLALIVNEQSKNFERINNIDFKILTSIIVGLKDMTMDLAKLSLVGLPAIIGAYLARLLIQSLAGIVIALNKVDFKIEKNKLTEIEDINFLIKSLYRISINIIKFSLISVVVLLALPLVLAGLLSVGLFITMLSVMFGNKLMKKLINRINFSLRAIVLVTYQLILVGLAIIGLALLAVPLVKATLLAVVSVIAIAGFLFALKFVLNIFNGKLIAAMFKRLAVISLLFIMIGTTLLLTATMLLGTATVAEKVLDKIGDLLLFIGALVGITTAMIGLGWVCTSAIVVVLPALIGIALITVMAGLLLGLSLMLLALQNITLDADLVKEKIADIMGITRSLTDILFYGDKENEESDKGFIAGVLGLFSMGGMIIKAIMSFAYVALMFFSVGMILCIAGMLTLLQNTDLNKDQILKNVDAVIATCTDIITILYDTPDNKNNPSNKGFIRSILEFFGAGPILRIVDAILSVAYVALMCFAVGLVWAIAGMLNKLQDLKLEKGKIEENVRTVIDTASSIINLIYDTPDNKDNPSNKGFIRSVLEFFWAGPILNIIDALMSVAYLALASFSIMMVMNLAQQLEKLQKIELDADAISKNVTTVITTAQKIISLVFQKDTQTVEGSDKGFLRKLINKVFPKLSSIVDALMAVGFLSISVTAVGMVGELAGYLTTIQKLPSMKGIEDKATTVIDTSKKLVKLVFAGDESLMQTLKSLENTDEAEDVLNSVINVVENYSKLADKLIKYGSTNINSVKQAETTTSEMLKIVNNIANAKIDETAINDKTDLIFRLTHALKGFTEISSADVKKTKSILADYDRFFTKIDKMNLSNLTTTKDMFEQMARFSESINGNFKELAEALNEEIAPALNQLKELMEKMPETVTTAATSINSTISDNAGGPVTSMEKISAQVQKDNPSLSDQEIEKKTQQIYQANSSKSNKKLLNNIYELLKNGTITVEKAK